MKYRESSNYLTKFNQFSEQQVNFEKTFILLNQTPSYCEIFVELTICEIINHYDTGSALTICYLTSDVNKFEF